MGTAGMRHILQIAAALVATSLTIGAANRTKVSQADGLRYVWIEPGKFVMGCTDSPGDCFNWELSPHLVEIKQGFWIGETEVTQQAYQRVTAKNPSLYRGLRLPVDQVGWDDAKRYCEKVGMKLPSEAQWEFAGREGKYESRYGPIQEIAWFDSNGGDQTHEVAQKQPNAFGLFDMIGNLWEWVDDSYDAEKKILKGDSFFNLARDLRVSNRLWATLYTRHRDMGFRCAR
jgi:formylglycine-generating enzyme required for sulfatase activity